MIKIVQLLSNPGVGGTETFVVGLTRELRDNGMDVRLANMWDGGGRLRELCSASGIDLECLDAGQRRFRLSARHTLRKYLSMVDPDIVVAYGLRTSLLLRLTAGWPRRPVLLTGLRNVDTWRRPLHTFAERVTDRWMDYYVGVSAEVCRKRLARERTDPTKVLLIPNGIDTEHFDRHAVWPDRNRLRLPPGRLVLTVANLRPQKGYAFYIDFIHRARPLPEDVSFVWIGEGPDRSALEAALAAHDLSDRVHLLGSVADVRPFMAHSTLFVLPSREEGMPRAMMEAMSMGLPVLATNVGGNAEVLRHGTDGIVVDYGDVQGAATALTQLIDGTHDLETMGRNSAARIRDDFELRVIASRYASLFRAVVASDQNTIDKFRFRPDPK